MSELVHASSTRSTKSTFPHMSFQVRNCSLWNFWEVRPISLASQIALVLLQSLVQCSWSNIMGQEYKALVSG